MAKKKPNLGNLMSAMAMGGKPNNPSVPTRVTNPTAKPTAKKKTAAKKPTTKTKCKKGC